MRLAVGAFLFEGNTFSPVVTRRADFEAKYCYAGDAVLQKLAGTGTEIAGAIAEAARRKATLAPLIATHGGAGGRVARDCHDEFVADLLARLAAALPVDGVYLALHGAFVAEGIDDVEGELLAQVRRIAGAVPIVVSCDMHAHVTPAMLTHCDALIGYCHYPHDDTFETGERALAILADTVAGRLKPATRACRVPLLAPAQRQRTRGSGPMAEIRARAAAREHGAIRAVSHFCVQPWMDLPGMGFTSVVVAHDDAAAASRVAREIAAMAWEARRRFVVETVAPRAGIRAGLAASGLVVLADAADCVGGGASGDSAAVLPALLTEAPGAPAALHIVDAPAAMAAHRAGVGARLRIGLGNKLDPSYGAPVDVEATVISISDGRFVYAGGLMKGVAAEMGPSAVLRVGAVDVLVGSRSAYEYGDEAFRANGVDARARKFVVVKNPMNYQQAYEGAGAMIILDTPGPTTPNLAGLPWRRADRPLFPLDADFTPAFVEFPA